MLPQPPFSKDNDLNRLQRQNEIKIPVRSGMGGSRSLDFYWVISVLFVSNRHKNKTGVKTDSILGRK